MVKWLGTGAIFRPKSGKYEWFARRVLGTEWLTGHNLRRYYLHSSANAAKTGSVVGFANDPFNYAKITTRSQSVLPKLAVASICSFQRQTFRASRAGIRCDNQGRTSKEQNCLCIQKVAVIVEEDLLSGSLLGSRVRLDPSKDELLNILLLPVRQMLRREVCDAVAERQRHQHVQELRPLRSARSQAHV